MLQEIRGHRLTAAIVGSVADGAAPYVTTMRARAEALGATLHLDADPITVAEILSASKLAFLPYEDGISSRRGTALAAIANGTLVVTTPPRAAADDHFRDLCVLGENTEELARQVEAVLVSADSFEGMRAAAQAFARSQDWASIAERYRAILPSG
ncbi:glycosyltransferase family protein [Aureimonas endophytica]|uniref:glycosyltransferase family protein n=1 Tax=Aureimonas endophytica TaxID=2027858 RepID=UPI0016682BB3|nr:glycosyltransferase [Aureimonas endophytica]